MRTEVQDGGEGNASTTIMVVLTKFAQGKGDPCSIFSARSTSLSHRDSARTAQIRPRNFPWGCTPAAGASANGSVCHCDHTTLFATNSPSVIARRHRRRGTARTSGDQTGDERAQDGGVDGRLKIGKQHPFEGAPRRRPAKRGDATQAKEENSTRAPFLPRRARGAGSAVAPGGGRDVAGCDGGGCLCRACGGAGGSGSGVHGGCGTMDYSLCWMASRRGRGGIMRKSTVYFLSSATKGFCVTEPPGNIA